MYKRDEERLREMVKAKLKALKKTLLCPIHNVSQPLLGTRFTRLEFDLLEFEGIAPVSLLAIKSLEEELVYCSIPECRFNAVWYCPLCTRWTVRIDPDSELRVWKCTTSFEHFSCPFKMTLPFEPSAGFLQKYLQ